MKVIKYIWDLITMPFAAVAVLIGECRQLEGHGDWDKEPVKKKGGR